MKTCSINDCNRELVAKGYCHLHYERYKRHGDDFNKTIYTKKMLNKIDIFRDYAVMKLCKSYGEVCGEVIIDIEDVEKIKDIKWALSDSGYACNKGRGLLHRFILGKEKNSGGTTDHINMNRLDNRKSNLRDCTNSQNMCNSNIPKNNKSGYKGVCWDNREKIWRSYIKSNYKYISLGQHNSKEEAALAYNNAAIKYHGEFARLNTI